jgi:hypothetical protein
MSAKVEPITVTADRRNLLSRLTGSAVLSEQVSATRGSQPQGVCHLSGMPRQVIALIGEESVR